MTLKQRLEALARSQETLEKQNGEMLSLLRRLAKGEAADAGPVAGDKPRARRRTADGRGWEVFLPGSGWMRDYAEGPPAPERGGR